MAVDLVDFVSKLDAAERGELMRLLRMNEIGILPEEVKLAESSLIQAVKAYRLRTGVDLSVARDVFVKAGLWRIG